MAMAESDKAIIRYWVGSTLTGDGWTQAEVDFDRLGSAYAVALQTLNTRLSDFAMQVTDVASASDRSSHASNIKAVRDRIDELVRVVRGSDDISLTPAAESLFQLVAQSANADSLTPVEVNFSHPRLA